MTRDLPVQHHASWHAASLQAYEDRAYRQLLASCRFDEIATVPSLGGYEGLKDKNYVVYIARAA